MPAEDAPADTSSSQNRVVNWFSIIAVMCVAIAAVVLGLRLLNDRPESHYFNNRYREQYEAEKSEKSNLLRNITADVDERAAVLEAHRDSFAKRYKEAELLAEEPPKTNTSDLRNRLGTPATDQQVAERYADADVTVLVAADGTPRIVESSRPSTGHVEVTRYYLSEQGRLMLMVRKNKGRTDLNDRWYFIAGSYVAFKDRGIPTEEPPPGGKHTTYRYVPSDEAHIGELHDELRAALVRTGLDTKAARIRIPGTAANDWTSTEFPPRVAPEPPPLLPRSDTTPAISHQAADEIFDYTRTLEEKPLEKVEKELAKPGHGDDPKLVGYFDGPTLVKVEHTHSSSADQRMLTLFYRDGGLVAIDVNEVPDADPSDGTLTWTYEHFSVVDGRIAMYWLEDGGVRAMFPASQRVQEIEAQAFSDDAAARTLFGRSVPT